MTSFLSVNASAIPDVLKIERRWMCWKSVWSDKDGKKGRWIKLPSQTNGDAAKPNGPSTWTSFEEALDAYRTSGTFAGIGFALGGGWGGIDLDDCIAADGSTITDAVSTVARLDECAAYYELSPSGTGLKVIGRASRYGGEIKYAVSPPAFTTWSGARFIAVTGTPRSHGDVATPSTNLTPLIDNWFAERHSPASLGPIPSWVRIGDTRGTENFERFTDEQVIANVLATPQADKFRRLVRGDMSEYGGDHSRADQALASILAYWCQGNLAQVDRLFRQTKLMRPKWNSASYRRATLSKAVSR